MTDRILMLRYSDFNGVDTISEHKKVIDKKGCCWWAKLGKQPRPQYLKEFLEQEQKVVLLYTSGSLHKCELGTVIRYRPMENYPAYYEEDIFENENPPSVYFELLSMEKIDTTFLDDYVICCSGKEVMYDLKNTISSFMFIQDKKIPVQKRPTRVHKKSKKINDVKSCKYKTEGICANRFCVNYKYECSNPQYCTKQRPIKTEEILSGEDL